MQQRVSQLYDQIIIGEPSFPVDTESIQASSLEDALDVLWQDPDPDTAGWVLMVQRVFNDKMINLNAIEKRSGLSTSLFLECQIKGQIHRDHDEFPIYVGLLFSKIFYLWTFCGLLSMVG